MLSKTTGTPYERKMSRSVQELFMRTVCGIKCREIPSMMSFFFHIFTNTNTASFLDT